MEQKSESSTAHENSSDTAQTAKQAAPPSKTPSTGTNAPTRKKFPPDHPYHFAWDVTEEELAKGNKYLIIVGGRFSQAKEAPSNSEPKSTEHQDS